MTKKKRPSEADLFAAAIQRGLRAWQNNGIDVKSGSINDVADSTTAGGTNGLHHGQQGEQREQKGENGSPHRDLDGPSCGEAVTLPDMTTFGAWLHLGKKPLAKSTVYSRDVVALRAAVATYPALADFNIGAMPGVDVGTAQHGDGLGLIVAGLPLGDSTFVQGKLTAKTDAILEDNNTITDIII